VSGHLGLFDTPPSRRDIALAATLAGALVIAVLCLIPVANVRVAEVPAFVPTVNAVVAGGELIIATLLYAQAAVFRSRALKVLASGFVFIAIMVVGHALTFPGAFAPNGLFDPGINSTAWIMIIRRLGFPVMTIAYALLKGAEGAAPPHARTSSPRVAVWIAGAVALALGANILAIRGDALFPTMFVNRNEVSDTNLTVFNFTNIAIVAAAMTVLHLRRSSVLDLWLQVALAGWLLQSVLNLWINARFTVGFYSLLLIILASHLFVLLALIAESTRLHARLALSTAAREREREDRVMSVEALAAAIFHEVGQPLAAVSLSAQASLKHLTGPQPSPEKAIESVRALLEATRRTSAVMKSARAAFTNTAGSRTVFSLNDVARETASLLERELRAQRISLHLDLDEDLPPVCADRVQIQRVLVNLMTNAIEAFDTTEAETRCISIRSRRPDGENVRLDVCDTGVGLSPEELAQIFEPYYTTKPNGTGLGLSLARTILEEHRGRLWASHGKGGGAAFHVQLPSSSTHGADR
jgi:signal transduction histidine kinase